MKRNGRRVIRELEADRERRVEIQRFACSACGKSFSIGRESCRAILFAKTEAAARQALTDLRRTRSMMTRRKWKAVGFLERHWQKLMMHHRVRGLRRTNNMAESFNKQIQRRLKTIESFQRTSTAIPYMNLLVAYLRLKPYTDCRGARRQPNGKNRLQVAGLTHLPKDWLTTCLKQPAFGNP